jgi:tRNA pseudouridine38-40 synthase
MPALQSHARISASFRLVVEYDGSRYQGWQRQGLKQGAAGVKTVAGTLDRILHKAGIKILNLTGAGRTDAGVHALGQVASLHLAQPIKPMDLRLILEQGLPYDIAVPRIAPCPQDFDARREAVSRSYLYQVALRKSAFAKSYTWWPKRSIDLSIAEEAWRLFEGNHSMSAFADLEDGESPRCQVESCRVKAEGQILLLRATARFFLRRQVRRMVGAALRCAIGEAKVAQIKKDLRSPSPSACRYWAELAAPASGLFLESVAYPGDQKHKELLPVLRIGL